MNIDYKKDLKDKFKSFWRKGIAFIRDEEGQILAEFDMDIAQDGSKIWSMQRYNYNLFGKNIAADRTGEDVPNMRVINPVTYRRYYFHDHLGNVRAVTDENGQLLYNYEYWPYGEEMTSSTYNEDSYRYTGHERDYDLNMDYMKSRHYKYEIGRFQQPDPINGKTGIPMSFNLYSYGLGNPLKFYDPKGKMVQYFIYGDEQYVYIGNVLGLEAPKSEKDIEEQSDEAKMPKEGDVIVREDEKSKTKDVAFVDGKDEQGRLLIFGFDKKTGKAKLVALGGENDMFGNYKVIGIIDPKKDLHFTRTWQKALKIFRKKYEGKETWSETFQCYNLTNLLLFKWPFNLWHNSVRQHDLTYYLQILEQKKNE